MKINHIGLQLPNQVLADGLLSSLLGMEKIREFETDEHLIRWFSSGPDLTIEVFIPHCRNNPPTKRNPITPPGTPHFGLEVDNFHAIFSAAANHPSIQVGETFWRPDGRLSVFIEVTGYVRIELIEAELP